MSTEGQRINLRTKKFWKWLKDQAKEDSYGRLKLPNICVSYHYCRTPKGPAKWGEGDLWRKTIYIMDADRPFEEESFRCKPNRKCFRRLLAHARAAFKKQ